MADQTERTDPISQGDTAPDFTLKDQAKNDWTLSEALKKGPVCLCFYPMAFSPICSTEMQCVTDQMEKWQTMGVQVVGISADSFFVQEAWARELGLKHTLLADMHRDVCKAYGFYWADLNISQRATVVIDQSDDGQGKVSWVQHRDIPDPMDFDEVLMHLG